MWSSVPVGVRVFAPDEPSAADSPELVELRTASATMRRARALSDTAALVAPYVDGDGGTGRACAAYGVGVVSARMDTGVEMPGGGRGGSSD